MFYTFNQNNSGGHFDPPAHYVIIEANSEKQAETLFWGLDSIDNSNSCPCCGSRWSGWAHDPTETPMIYGTPAAEYNIDFLKEPKVPTALVVYLDLHTETFN